MKKTYMHPVLHVVKVNMAQACLLSGSVTVDGNKTSSSTDGGWSKKDNDWDIWGDN